jgi:hypothetical protein
LRDGHKCKTAPGERRCFAKGENQINKNEWLVIRNITHFSYVERYITTVQVRQIVELVFCQKGEVSEWAFLRGSFLVLWLVALAGMRLRAASALAAMYNIVIGMCWRVCRWFAYAFYYWGIF